MDPEAKWNKLYNESGTSCFLLFSEGGDVHTKLHSELLELLEKLYKVKRKESYSKIAEE